MNARCLSICLLLAFSAGAVAESVLQDVGNPPLRLAGTENREETKTYIVQLRRPPAAAQQAASMGVSPIPPPGAARSRISRNNPETRAYVAQLRDEQKLVLDRTAPNARRIYSYGYGLNGFAARMTAAEAHKLEGQPEVLKVWEDEVRPLATRDSPTFLGLFDADKGLRSVGEVDGENIVIAVIDSGVTPEHPGLKDTREADMPRACRSNWGKSTILGRWLCRRYRRLPEVFAYDPPEDWNGACETGERFTAEDCNNKLIGARWFIDGALQSGPIDEGEIRSPRDADGHGTHTATTAAGKRTSASIFGTAIGDVEGMAPRARIAVYKACWLRPGDTRASCNTSDLANAIDMAVADGVDVISYSIGSSLARTTAPDDLALLAATKAGVVAVVAAGNEGPNNGTIGSPAGSPAVITVAASTRDGSSDVEALEITAPPSVADRYAAKEAFFTPPLEDVDPIESTLVLADDGDATLPSGRTGSEADGCQPLINGDEVDGKVVLLQRTGCRFDEMVRNAADAGAVAAVVYNVAGDPIVMRGESGLSDIPALMMGQADANLLLAEFDAGNEVEIVLDKGLLLTTDDDGNEMATFSARGPGPIPDVLKPDVTAPGVNILAGFSPDSAYATPGENFAYLSGTSMATPHVAGVAALLLQAHPEWSPAAIKSALMTSARQDVTSGTGVARPFDFGAGHIVPNDADNPGLVYDLTPAEYDEMEAGLADENFNASHINLPSITMSQLASSQTVTRRVTNVDDESGTYSVAVTAPPGMRIDVAPPSLSLAPGQSASFEVTLSYESGPLDLWRYGSIEWQSDDIDVFSPVVVQPVSVVAPREVESRGGTGTLSFDVQFGYSGAYSPQVHGLNLPLILDGFVDNDPDKTFSFRSGNGVTQHVISIPANQLYARFALFDRFTDGDDDLDMYVYYCGTDGASCSKIGESGGPTSEERFDIDRPAAGLYAVLVHGFETDEIQGGPGANYQLFGWAFGEVDDKGNLSASGPAFVNAGTTDAVTLDWSQLAANSIYFGGISHLTPQGLSALTLVTIEN
jgi:subtilisin family serine protease